MLIRGKYMGIMPICQNQTQKNGCINSIFQNNNTISNHKSKPMTNNNVSFGRSISYYVVGWWQFFGAKFKNGQIGLGLG